MVLKSFIFLLLVVKSHGLYSNSSDVVILNDENFDKLVKNVKEIWVVEFYAPWCKHCQNFVKEYEKAARALAGIVKVGVVNAEDNPTLSDEYDIQGYPTLKIFNSASGLPDTYKDEHTARALVSYISVKLHSKINAGLDGNLDPSMFKTKDIVELTEINFDELVLSPRQIWLVVYYSPFSKKCKKLSALWVKVSANLKGIVKLGALDATIHFAKASDCKIEGYPAIKFFSIGKKTVTSGITYSGKQTSEDIIKWTFNKIVDNAPVPEITQILDLHSLEQACENKPLCIVSIFPHILNCKSECRNNYLDILKTVSENNKKALWGWVWSEAGAQPAIESALKIDTYEHPTVAAVDVKKGKYSVFTGILSVDSVNDFLQDFAEGVGEQKLITTDKLPPIKITQPWDGLDIEAVDEETDSDINDMGDLKDEL